MTQALPDVAKGPAVAFVIGLLVTAVYAWQRFNEPTFSHQDTLPRTVAPLRYFFLRPAYRRARCTYTAVSLLVYALVVALGPAVVSVLGINQQAFAPEALPLLVALILVGVVPNSNIQWLTRVEEELRRAVHKWFLVPDGVQKTIGILEDAHFDPPASQLNAVPSPLKEKIKEGLRLPRTSLRYRWARTAMLMESLRQMGSGTAHPLRKAAFEPFQEDFRAIREKYQILKQDVEPIADGSISNEGDNDALTASVDHLLTRIYAYISWGIRHQADTDRDVDQTLHELGFRVPPTNDRRLFDIVLPAIVLIVAITSAFSAMVDSALRRKDLDETVVNAVFAATAAGLMYGGAVWIALRGRANQIDQKVWRQGSPKCLVPIAIKAGLMTWAVIIITTALESVSEAPQPQQSLSRAFESLLAMWSTADHGEALTSAMAWLVTVVKMGTAVPWALAGATVSVVLCRLLGGDVRRTGKRHCMRDATTLGGWLALAAALAFLIQLSLNRQLDLTPPGQQLGNLKILGEVALTGLAAFACGAVIGYKVPQASRADLEKPFDNTARRALGDLLGQAELALGSRADAENWVFMPRDDLGGIAPAEAIRYRGHATGVKLLLEGEVSSRRGDDTRPDRGERPAPVVIEGGRSAG